MLFGRHFRATNKHTCRLEKYRKNRKVFSVSRFIYWILCNFATDMSVSYVESFPTYSPSILHSFFLSEQVSCVRLKHYFPLFHIAQIMSLKKYCSTTCTDINGSY